MIRHAAYTLFAVLLSMAVIAGPASAQSASENAAQELTGILQDYETYQADFIQILVNDRGHQVQETTGLLKAKRPGWFYWETGNPLPQYIVSDGDKVEVYDPDLEQVTIQSLDERVQSTPALLLTGEVDNLNEMYEVTEKDTSVDGYREFTLVPRAPDSLFTSLRLSFREGQLSEMRMEDSLSQLSILSFDNVRLNEPVSDDAFRLDYPEGVDIIRDGL